ncbi:hypothetical protein GWI33_018088 [Rhynchophorus ferrugineus]|uniref:Uncharacterized protein n=1 Tax=Rhynchophorus ferrugineus TaxID=354439 RepID=A0A834M1S2_RHYFE|nr:hypothetical protein GWI33_018088 [Rhynchophorus ferrugineus]
MSVYSVKPVTGKKPCVLRMRKIDFTLTPKDVTIYINSVHRGFGHDANKGPSITIRSKRSPDDDWIFRPDLSRDDRGNTRGEARVEKHGDDYDINAQYGQTFRGPDKHSEAWHIGGSFRW